jgi:hypothetical protein
MSPIAGAETWENVIKRVRFSADSEQAQSAEYSLLEVSLAGCEACSIEEGFFQKYLAHQRLPIRLGTVIVDQ